MNIYLVAAFLLLLAMLALVMRPFLYATEPTLDGPVDLSDPAAKARAVAKVERVRRPDAPAAATTVTPAAPPVAETPPDDVRASVEAAIAARKAALKAKHCTACEAVLENGDAFCRSCGTKVTA
jgi:nucleoid-associated protein YgaU